MGVTTVLSGDTIAPCNFIGSVAIDQVGMSGRFGPVPQPTLARTKMKLTSSRTALWRAECKTIINRNLTKVERLPRGDLLEYPDRYTRHPRSLVQGIQGRGNRRTIRRRRIVFRRGMVDHRDCRNETLSYVYVSLPVAARLA